MHRLGEALTNCDREATIIQDSADFHPGWFRSQVNTIEFKKWLRSSDLDPRRDLVVIPETFINVFEAYAPSLPKIIFNQNGAYSFGTAKSSTFPDPCSVLSCYRDPRLLHVLCVSENDEKLLSKGFGLGASRVSRLINPIETNLFCPGPPKRRQIAYMPRKNSHDAAVVTSLLQVQPWWSGWEQADSSMFAIEVAQILRESVAFMAFGHPEGFGLPIAEALACGCAVVGYSGLGGREPMELGAEYGVALEVAFGDWQGFLDALCALDRSLQNYPHKLQHALLLCSKNTSSLFDCNVPVQREDGLDTLGRALVAFYFWYFVDVSGCSYRI